MCFMVNIYVFGCLGVPWGVVECHGVISSTVCIVLLINTADKLTNEWMGKKYIPPDILCMMRV